MKEIVKIMLFVAIILPSCSTSKLAQNDIKYLQNHWIHSHEEDIKNSKVYRPSEYSFKPSRGREEIEIKAGGLLRYRPLSPNDEPIFYNGNWKLEGSTLELHFNSKTEIYRIIEISSNSLKLK